jgi:hypothetical protein
MIDEVMGNTLLGAMLSAPLIAVYPRNPSILHGADMDTICEAWPYKTVTAACGKQRLRLMSAQYKDGPRTVVLWPPRVKGLPDGTTRCKECHAILSPKRPRVNYIPNEKGDK